MICFVKKVNSLHRTQVTSRYLSSASPKGNETSSTSGIFLHETNQVLPNETYVEAALWDWMVPQPCPCAKEFKDGVPSGVQAVLGPPRLDVSSNSVVQPWLCDGVRFSSPRIFPNEKPFELFVSLHHFSSNGLITKPQQLPPTITIDNQPYALYGCTFWSGLLYNSCIKYQKCWFSYDGLQERNLKGSGLQPSTIASLLPAGYVLSLCMHHIQA